MADVRTQKKMGKGRHASAIKRHRQSEKRRMRNKAIKSRVKTAIRGVKKGLSAGDKDTTLSLLKMAVSELHKAASKGVIPKKRASRLSSRLTKAINKTLASAPQG